MFFYEARAGSYATFYANQTRNIPTKGSKYVL